VSKGVTLAAIRRTTPIAPASSATPMACIVVLRSGRACE
jgi:hypothetical protein